MNKIDICCNNIKVQTNKQNEIIDRNVNSIKNSSEHILNMVSRIKKYTYDFSIVESNFELTNIIEKVVEMMNPYIEKKHISIIKDFGYCTNMIADCSHIQEVLLSLLKNSVEAINHKGEILIKTKRNNKFIIIEVIDNGCGINKNNLKRIVHPFFTTKNNTTNFGLGLAYSSNVILKHGGKLLISSHEGIGTKVSICLPISRIPGAIKNKNLG
ncbi:sensor histidine kinase [Pseudobacteroides cellulosolvens]|nr:HAMP domain-containing sensor histidine kinase [Pseudobacteroides cellulosolvens]